MVILAWISLLLEGLAFLVGGVEDFGFHICSFGGNYMWGGDSTHCGLDVVVFGLLVGV